MKSRLALAVLVVGALVLGSMPLLAQTGPGYPTDESLAYSQWCQYMDSLKHQRTLLGWRMLLDTSLSLLGVTAFFVESASPTPSITKKILAAVVQLAGTIDFFAFTSPRYGAVAYEMLLFKKTGADRMWVWPCNGTGPSW